MHPVRNDFADSVLESIVDGVLVINAEAEILFANEAACRLFGYSKEELVGHSMNRLLPQGVSGPDHDRYITSYLETGKARVIGIGREVMGKRKDGTTFPFWLGVNEMKWEGKIYFSGLIHDLSKQKKTERALAGLTKELEAKVAKRTKELADTVNQLLKINLRLKEEIQEKEVKEIALKNSEETLKLALQKEKHLNEMKSRFLSMASHEFKTPLSAILSSASLLERYTTTEQQEKREKHIQKIKRMIRQLNDILNDFLSVERLDASEVPVHYTTIDIEKFVRHVVEELENILKKQQKIKLIFKLPKKEIRSDSHIFRIVLRNLLSNAIKYSPEGSEVTVKLTDSKGRLLIRIQDEGIGIPKKEIEHIFTRFYRSSNAANIQGTGLGLAIVKRYVGVLGGEIKCRSKEGAGSVFFVYLPYGGK